MANTPPSSFIDSHWRPEEDFTRIANILIKTKYISSKALHLYIYLGSYKKSYPSYKRIQEDIGFSRATIAKVKDELVKKGLIHYTRGKSRWRANEYVLLPPDYWRLNLHCPDATAPFRLYLKRHRKKSNHSQEYKLVEKLYGVSSDFEPVTRSEDEQDQVQETDHTNTNYQYEYNEDEVTEKRVATASDDERLPGEDCIEPDFDSWRDGPHGSVLEESALGAEDKLELEGNEYAEW